MTGPTIFFTDPKTATKGTAALLILLVVSLTVRYFVNSSKPETIVFDRDPRNSDIPFTPTVDQIDKAENGLIDFLETRVKNQNPITVEVLDKTELLQSQLKYYRRRYIGSKNVDGSRIIKIEFVFVRCGGQDEWKRISYTSDTTNGCWWSVRYNLDSNKIYDLSLRRQQTIPLTSAFAKAWLTQYISEEKLYQQRLRRTIRNQALCTYLQQFNF